MHKSKSKAQSDKSLILSAAVVATLAAMGNPGNVYAGVSGGTGQQYLIQTTGATALSTFTSAAGNRGTYLLGTNSLVIGGSTYTLSAAGQSLGINNTGSITPVIEPPLTADRLVYSYHQSGSVNGILDLSIRNGLLLSGTPIPVNASNPLFVMGQSHANVLPASFSNGYVSYYDNTVNNAPAIPVIGGFYDTSTTQKPMPQVAYSDVRAEQAFAIGTAGSAAVDRAPVTNGYGFGQSQATSGLDPAFQQLRPVGDLVGGLDAGTTHLRNESLAVIPFTVSANPGTGLDGVTESDVKFLETKGRLKNGANFNFVTRDIGSGTRNQGANNFNLDASWAGGERDRRFLGTSSYSTAAETGASVTVDPGDEQSPRVSIVSTTASVNINEHRPSAIARFADKTSGTSAVRPVLLSNRMSLGILSAGDVNELVTSNFRGSDANSTQPLRVLAIDFDDVNGGGEAGAGAGFVQPSALNVTTGVYQHWSAAQAVTVVGSLATGTNSNGLTGGTLGLVDDDTSAVDGRPILNDVDDDGSGTGVVRKFLDNVRNSINQNLTTSAATPFEALAASGFIPTQLMKVNKGFDGSMQTTRTLSNVDPDGGDPGLSEQALYEALVDPDPGAPSNLNLALGFAVAGSHNGNITSQRYRIFDTSNTTSAGSPTGTVEITFTARNFLAGDLNDDDVRDLEDVEAWAHAYANSDDFLANIGTNIDDGVTVTNNSGGANGNLNSAAVNTSGKGGLLTLTDLNGDGNVVVVDAGGADVATPNPNNPASFAAWTGALSGTGAGMDRIVPVSREDVKFFLYGAAVETNLGDTAQERREIGVRTGQLSKNTAIIRFNEKLDDLADTAVISQPTADALKFNRFDTNGDGTVNRLDAKLVNDMVGKDYTDLEDVLGTPIDLISVELTDNNLITHIDPNMSESFDGTGIDLDDINEDSDMQQMVAYVVSIGKFVPGDANFDGTVNILDGGILSGNWQTSVGQYGLGDFNFDGLVNILDGGILSANWQSVAPLFESLLAVGFDEETAAAIVSVPEPASVGIIGLMAGGMLLRRRRSGRA